MSFLSFAACLFPLVSYLLFLIPARPLPSLPPTPWNAPPFNILTYFFFFSFSFSFFVLIVNVLSASSLSHSVVVFFNLPITNAFLAGSAVLSKKNRSDPTPNCPSGCREYHRSHAGHTCLTNDIGLQQDHCPTAGLRKHKPLRATFIQHKGLRGFSIQITKVTMLPWRPDRMVRGFPRKGGRRLAIRTRDILVLFRILAYHERVL